MVEGVDVGVGARIFAAGLVASLVLLITGAPAVAQYPPDPDPDAGPVTPEPDDPDPAPSPAPRPPPPPAPEPSPDEDPAPVPDPDLDPTPEPTAPTPAPDPTPEAPEVDPGGGTGDRDGEPFEIRVRPAPPEVDPDDPVLRIVLGVRTSEDGDRIFGLPPREDGTPREPTLGQVVLVEAGPLGLLITGESCGQDQLDVDESGALRTTPGGSILVAGGGFLGQAEVATWLYSEPMLLRTAVTEVDGTVIKSAPVPDDVMFGRHTVQIAGVGADRSEYRVSLDVMVVDCDPGRGLLGLPRMAFGLLCCVLAFLAALLLGSLRWWLIPVRRRLRIAVAAHPGLVPIAVERRAVARIGRRPVDAELRGGPSGLEDRDRAVRATGLRVVGVDVLDLDRRPVPVAATVVVEAADATWILAVRGPDGAYEPAADDGLPRLLPGATLVTIVDGARRGSRLEISLVSLRDKDDDRGIEDLVLGPVRADAEGRARGEVILPETLGTLPLVIGLRLRGR